MDWKKVCDFCIGHSVSEDADNVVNLVNVHFIDNGIF